ncbi:MAG: mechanosensitive ion channel [Planctomycetes bacterium]|nr:mechanosensitive ion channel [Planctomycetota bacterium]MBI3848218.1 mechanosensitive ion channel [Planctomycetota bacterium]
MNSTFDSGLRAVAFVSFGDTLQRPLFEIGDHPVSIMSLIVFASLVILTFLGARLAARVVIGRALAHTKMTEGMRYALQRMFQYVLVVIGLFVALHTLGINVESFVVLAGALGVGIGFGLQNIVSNFVSGLIILAERPIEVGDRIEIGGSMGRVTNIGTRSTTILTNDNIAIIVPNADFISKSVTNWTHGDPKVRFKIPVGVAYGTDERLVTRALLEVADEDEDTLKDPPPQVRFHQFGESSLDFLLQVWTETRANQPTRYRSQINYAIAEKFRRHGIPFPFPQRDLHLVSGSLKWVTDRSDGRIEIAP